MNTFKKQSYARTIHIARSARWRMAEREGFEPSLQFPVNTLSKRAPSATRPPLRGSCVT